MSNESLRLPACSKCRVRKVRCDRQAPKCGNCTKGNAACIIIDIATGEQYARDFIQQLEVEEAQLKAHLHARTSVDGPATAHSDHAERTPRGPLTGETEASHSGFVGDGSGLGFVLHRHSINLADYSGFCTTSYLKISGSNIGRASWNNLQTAQESQSSPFYRRVFHRCTRQSNSLRITSPAFTSTTPFYCVRRFSPYSTSYMVNRLLQMPLYQLLMLQMRKTSFAS